MSKSIIINVAINRTLEFARVRVCLYELKIEKNINDVRII